MTTTISQNLITPNTSIIYDSGELTSAVTTLDATGLNLAAFEQYHFFFNFYNNEVSQSQYNITVNGDNTYANYRCQGTESFDTNITAFASQNPYIAFAKTIKNCTGNGRIMHSVNGAFYYSSDIITNTGVVPLAEHATYYGWKDDTLTGNITTVRFSSNITDGIGIGSRVQIINPLGS